MTYIDELFNLNGKVAVVTGGNGQLGTEYTQALAQAGAKVAVFDIQDELNESLKKLSESSDIAFYKVDITKKEEIKDALNQIESLWSVPNILINNAALDSPPGAGAGDENKSLEDYSKESWDAVWGVNVTGTFLCSQVIGARMAENGGGSIINISSHYGLVSPDQRVYKYREKKGEPFVKPISYSATKSAILNLTRYLAAYWGDKSVRVNSLAPGGVFNNQDEEFLQEYNKRVPLGRMAKSNEYNGAILFLSSDASSYVTGSILVADGGYTAW